MVKKPPHFSDSPLVSIVILNWNGAEDTIECLKSVRLLDYKSYEVIVVDNGSESDFDTLKRFNDGSFKLVRNDKNLGFAGGEISALPHCKGEFLLLLNNDAIIEKHSLTEAMKTFQKDQKIAVVGGKSYLYEDGERTTHRFYSYQKVDPITAEVHTYTNDAHTGRPEDTVTVSGSAVVIRRSVIDELGYFDNRFFAYYEETDLFARYLRSGYRIVYNPKLIIWHKDGASTRSRRYMYYYLMLKNQYLFATKNFNKTYLKAFRKTYWRNFRRSLWIYARIEKR